MKIQGSLLTAAIIAALTSATALAAPAEPQTDEFTLEQVIVTAQRQNTKELDTPASVDVLTADDIKKSGARTIFDALSFIPGITNFSYGPGGADYGAMDSRVNIRGFERGALILINGTPVNLNGKNSLDGIMADSVDRIEVVKGAASVLYGAEAMGGVVNIITKKGSDREATNLSVTAGNQGYDKESFSYQNDRASVMYTKQHFGEQDRTSPNREDRGYYNNRSKSRQDNYFATVNLTDQLNLTYMRSEADFTYGQFDYKTNPKNTKDWRYNDVKQNVNLAYDNKDNDFKATIFYNARDLYGAAFNHSSPKKGFVANASNYKAHTTGLDVQKAWSWREDKDKILVGALVSGEEYQGTSKENSNVNPNRHNYALYAQYSYAVSPKLTAIAGFREQIVDDPVKDQHVFIPQFQTVYKVNDSSSWYTNIGKAFQMPSLSDSYKSVSGQYAPISGRNLKPQEGWNYETGYKIINDHNSWKFAVYHMDMKNAFAWAKDDEGQDIRINTGKFKNTGLEIEHSTVLNANTKAIFGMNWSNPLNKDNDQSDWQQTYPKLQFTTGLQYNQEKWDMGVSLNWLTKRLKNRDGGTNPDLININAMVTYKASDTDQVVLNLNNLLDRDNVITNGDWEYYDLPFNWALTYRKTL